MTGPQAQRTVWALLDTGADESYIAECLANKLGLVPLSEQRGTINSASGKCSRGVWQIGIIARSTYASGALQRGDEP